MDLFGGSSWAAPCAGVRAGVGFYRGGGFDADADGGVNGWSGSLTWAGSRGPGGLATFANPLRLLFLSQRMDRACRMRVNFFFLASFKTWHGSWMGYLDLALNKLLKINCRSPSEKNIYMRVGPSSS